MKKIFFAALLTLFLFSASDAYDQTDYYPPEYPNGLYIETGGGRSPDSLWIELGMMGNPSEYIEYRASLSHLGVEKNTQDKNYFTGFNIGARIKFSSLVSPFIGAGIFSGYAFEDITADDDGKDNDGDGEIDEQNEKKAVVDDIIFCFYPEAGLYLQFQNNSKIYLSSKYMISSEEETGNFFLFTIGFSFTY
jgi:hypothetical protein